MSRVPAPPMIEVWCTRDSDAHGTWDMIDVWLRLPERNIDPSGGAFWSTGDEGADKIDRVHVNVARKRKWTTPDDDRQCVRMYIKEIP